MQLTLMLLNFTYEKINQPSCMDCTPASELIFEGELRNNKPQTTSETLISYSYEL